MAGAGNWGPGEGVAELTDHAAVDGATERTRSLLETGRFREAIEAAARGLHEQRLNAQLWVHLAQALESTGHPAAAWAAFDRAWLLDPRAPWADSVCDRLGSHAGRPVPGWLSDLLQTPDIPLTGAVLARDEADSIAATLESVKPAVDRLIVIDTGGTDNTPDIARDVGAEVVTVAWTDDFSAARNFGLSHISSGWVWWVNADEILDPKDIHTPKRAVGLYDSFVPPAVLRAVLINDENRQNKNYDVARLFPVRLRNRSHSAPNSSRSSGSSFEAPTSI